ncbi:unnamed protein product [Mycena citricolor]|uniref:Uncharacterized protein n=1 Tax=Mycena citricolor TaxID=2018698 RepID=A0AAD2HSG4_9AGAR|nr:unnamed protein product [Mycena citricolor]
MASAFNLTLDDCSPLISYGPSGAWRDASSNDTASLGYFGNTYHSTNTTGATVTINFNGTGIEIYGAHRPEYGSYSMTMDGQSMGETSAASSAVQAQQLLGSATELANGPHTAVITSNGSGMDIDWVNLLTQVGVVGSTMTTSLVDDADPRVNYAGKWQTNNLNTYMNNTLHYSSTAGSAASLSFSGNAVAIYGTVSPDHANIQVSIDGQSQMVNTQASSISALHPQTLLYYSNGLDSSQHTLIITNPGQQSGTGPFIDLDAVAVYSATAPPTVSGAAPNALNDSANRHGSKIGALSRTAFVGILAGILSLVLLAIAGVFLFFFLRRRRASRYKSEDVDPTTPTCAELPLQGPNARFTMVSPTQPLPTFSGIPQRQSSHSIAPSYYAFGNESRSSFASTTPLAPTLGMPKPPNRNQPNLMVPSNLVSQRLNPPAF